jgi:(S)-2-hydroxyglutarate dehydrogenase
LTLKVYDYVIVGAGILGLAVARELVKREPATSVLVLEKEAMLGAHGSGRNSGVLHSGIYYPAGSLKARVCGSGAKAMADYCLENRLPFARVGKVIVPATEADDPQVDLLYTRAQANGAKVTLIDSQELAQLEPECRSATGRGLYSPDTAVVDPIAILKHLGRELNQKGVAIRFGESVSAADPQRSSVTSSGATFGYRHLINASGQFADRVAHLFQVGAHFTMIPFKGLYYRLREHSGIRVNGLIYPVPDLNVPFLGIHTVKVITGGTFFGPTAVPAFGRAHYRGLYGIEPLEALHIAHRLLQQYFLNEQNFRQFAHREAARFLKHSFAKAAQAIVPRLKADHLESSNKVGIRAQLLDRQSHKLVMDFVVAKGDNTTHILNAVSPGFTSAFSFAEFIVNGLFSP